MFTYMACLVAISLLLGLAAADATGNAEVDVVFPRNDTFEPMPLMPVVFAIQNPAAVRQLYPSLHYMVAPLGQPNRRKFESLDIRNLPVNETTAFLYRGVPNLLDTEGMWEFSWELRWINCSTSDNGTDFDGDDTVEDLNGFHRRTYSPLQTVFFTTRQGGTQPNLTAISTGDTCDETQALGFNVRQYLQVPDALSNDGVTSCALLASPAPTPRPCEATLGPDAASSISASITSRECVVATPAVSCPPKDDAAAGHGVTAGLLLSAGVVSGQTPSRQGASPGYQGLTSACPERCIISGPNPSNWSVYQRREQLNSCKQAMFYSFNLYDNVDETDSHHQIFACTLYGNDWAGDAQAEAADERPAKEHMVNYEIGWSTHSSGTESVYRALIKQIRDYVANGNAASNRTSMLYAEFGHATAGLYIGNGLRSSEISYAALEPLVEDTHQFDGQRDSLFMQLCGPDYDSQHVVGFMATNNGTFEAIQSAFKSWSNADCLEFDHSRNFTASAYFTTPMLSSIKGDNATTNGTSASAGNSTSSIKSWKRWTKAPLISRGECRTEKVQQDDSCAALAKRCGISGADFTKYNSEKAFCSKLRPGQHVCCSSGEMPDFRPKPNKDGSCVTTRVGDGESCSSIGAANSLTNDDIDGFNKHTWGWTGCKNILKDAVICISKGSPPMPAEVADAECGPQVPGTKPPKDMTKLADLNQCPLNACCNTWGHCGTTDEFCTDTGTGAPGTAKPGTNGCISNCGTKIVKGNPPSQYRSVGYYEGFQFKRNCLFQDALQIDESQYTHLHFGFGDISQDYQISIGDDMMKYEFNNFRYIRGPKKILSFGGWDFSTQPETYQILRQGTTPANRMTLAKNIANFIKDNNLDGVDIDWEYPGAPDIPGVPPGDKHEGQNYVAFLALLKNLLPGKSISIAAPASYWYLKGFPIDKISKIVDYIVFMTYDLHGQWDAGNPNAQIGCSDGMCLRSHVNLTETMNSLAMVTKAGADSGKIVVGVSSYGRSFKMASAGCYGPSCKYTGGRLSSNAKKGECTDTAGYISNAEINDIIADSTRVTKHFVDTGSNSNILVYDETEYVAYMTPDIRSKRTSLYKGLSMGGSVNWATDLEKFIDSPSGVGGWKNFKLQIKAGNNPVRHAGSRHGNWTKLTCDDPYYQETADYTPAERWAGLGSGDAWGDIVDDWKKYRDDANGKPRLGFTAFIVYLIGGPPGADCSEILSGSSCRQTLDCKNLDENDKTGPAATLIWNSFVKLSSTYAKYHDSLVAASALLIDNSLDDLENKFAPVPPPKDDSWLSILLGFVSMGTPMIVITKLPALASKTPAALEKGKTAFNTILSGGVLIGTNLKGSPKVDDWTSDAQDQFSNYLGQSLYVWDNITTVDLRDLFDGSDKSIDRLTTIISGGTFIDGVTDEATHEQKKSVEDSFIRAFYGFAIPAVWKASGHHPFIIDTGRNCDDDDGSKYTKDLKSACHDGRLYQLADPDGKSHPCSHNCGFPGGCSCPDSSFSSLKGVGELDGSSWGKVKVEDIIIGAVKTYKQNGEENGGDLADPTDSGSFDSLVKDDVTTPGYIRLPVCSETLARTSWENADKTDGTRNKENFPCNIDNGRDYCTGSTFEDQTSDASPPVSDCLQIVKNIEGTDGSWNTFIEMQREILHFGECKFGVTGKGRKGNSNFDVGAQDVVDIIRDAVKQFGGGGKIGAKGTMQCNGNIKQQKVEWGLY
ncbi:Lysine--tRNA ligase [Purpureocillium lavendulum]|uniref:chitinase n=1 Tax=Purpureocillium lavendulum TaxID=1247861 RepID=A0AB34G1L2_9HYPO|nr:Lysine--tRNA ligase [Purpureocillium lavendulum]